MSYRKFEGFKKQNKICELLTNSQSILLKNGCIVMSEKPVCGWQPNLSAGFLFRKPFKTDCALTEIERGIRMVFSSMT